MELVESFLKRFGEDAERLREAIVVTGEVREFESGSMLYYPGAVCEFVPVVLWGGVKVYVVSSSGREILLYTVGENETCLLTSLSVLRRRPYPAYATTSKNSMILLLKGDTARMLFNSFQSWRDFVLDMFVKDGWLLADRLSEVISRRVDRRLIDYLLTQVKESNQIRATHEDIAKDIGTVREVVSRLLKRFESQGLITLGRGVVEVIDMEGLKALLEE